MAFRHVGGLDHAVIMVDSLERAAAQWAALGFTVSPLGLHSAHVGAANHTVVLERDYVELMGVLRETESNAPALAFLKERGPGLERFALATDDAGGAAVELRGAGLDATGPFSFGRPVPLPGGGETEARFRITRWPPAVKPAGVRIFVCEHQTREAVWRPELQTHANTATGIRRFEIVTPDPAGDADAMAAAIGRSSVPGADGGVLVPTGQGFAMLVFLTAAQFAARYPGVPAAVLPARSAMALVFTVRDRRAALEALGPGAAQYSNDCIYALPEHATGTVVAFEEQ